MTARLQSRHEGCRPVALRADPAFASLRRSLDVYYGDAPRDAAMDALYARFVRPAISPSTSAPTSAIASAASAASARASWRWSRSRCARVPSARSTPATAT